MYSWRITKYNPVHRNEDGIYQHDEWTSFHDIGKEFNGVSLGIAEYENVEMAYVKAVQLFMNGLGISALTIRSIEKSSECDMMEMPGEINSSVVAELLKRSDEGTELNRKEVEQVCRMILREMMWCKLEYEALLYVHFGYDYYMYISCEEKRTDIIDGIVKLGLYVEEMESPYL